MQELLSCEVRHIVCTTCDPMPIYHTRYCVWVARSACVVYMWFFAIRFSFGRLYQRHREYREYTRRVFTGRIYISRASTYSSLSGYPLKRFVSRLKIARNSSHRMAERSTVHSVRPSSTPDCCHTACSPVGRSAFYIAAAAADLKFRREKAIQSDCLIDDFSLLVHLLLFSLSPN